MPIGLAILVVGILFCLVYLYSITRDRWNWKNFALVIWIAICATLIVTAHLVFTSADYHVSSMVLNGTFGILLLAMPIIAATRHKINWARIRRIFTATGGSAIVCALFLIGYAAIDLESKRRDLQSTINKEESARECNLKEIRRIESLITTFNKSITGRYASPEKTIIALDQITTEPSKISISNTNIKNQTIEAKIKPNCDSKFFYSIRIGYDEFIIPQGIQVFANYPPRGYPEISSQNINAKSAKDHSPLWIYPEGLPQNALNHVHNILLNYLDSPNNQWETIADPSQVLLRELSVDMGEQEEFSRRRAAETNNPLRNEKTGRDLSEELFGRPSAVPPENKQKNPKQERPR